MSIYERLTIPLHAATYHFPASKRPASPARNRALPLALRPAARRDSRGPPASGIPPSRHSRPGAGLQSIACHRGHHIRTTEVGGVRRRQNGIRHLRQRDSSRRPSPDSRWTRREKADTSGDLNFSLRPTIAPVPSPPRAFRPNQAALDLFPTTLWAQLAARRWRRASARMLAGGETLGYLPLREAVADYLNTSRGVKCTVDQVLIVSGALEGLDRTTRLLVNPGEPVWMEEPGYPGAAAVLSAAGARIRGVPVDAEGLHHASVASRSPRPKLIYVTPAHQFPLGVTMSLRR